MSHNRNGTHSMLTSAKLTEGYLVVEIIKELNKELSLHCSSIYINTTWSVLQQYLVHASTSCPLTKATMPYTCALTSYSLISTIHMCTICTPLSGAVHTGLEVRRMDSEMSGLVERPWLQLMCCAICLLHGRNFR